MITTLARPFTMRAARHRLATGERGERGRGTGAHAASTTKSSVSQEGGGGRGGKGHDNDLVSHGQQSRHPRGQHDQSREGGEG